MTSKPIAISEGHLRERVPLLMSIGDEGRLDMSVWEMETRFDRTLDRDYELVESCTVEGYTTVSGERGYYNIWSVKVYGADIADRYDRLNLTPKDVKTIVGMAEESIGDAIYDAIDKALNEYMGSH